MENKHKFIIAIIILICVASVLLITFISLSLHNKTLSSEGHTTVTQIITALIAIVSMIAGANNQNNNKS